MIFRVGINVHLWDRVVYLGVEGLEKHGRHICSYSSNPASYFNSHLHGLLMNNLG